MNEWLILSLILFGVSFLINIILIRYVRQNIVRVFVISEEASEIFTRLDSFQDHLKSIYELPLFYGDDTLSGLLDHSRSLTEYLERYEGLYSFTQPDLIEQLDAASEELQEKHDQEEAQAQEKE